MAEENQGAVATKGTVRTWTEEEKDLVWEQALKAKAEGLPLTEAFRRCAKLLPHRSEAAVGMLYYNVLRKEREEPAPQPKSSTARPKAEFSVDPKLLEAFQGLPEYMQALNKRIELMEKRLEEPDPVAILKALSQLAANFNNQDETNARLKELQEEITELQKTNAKLQKDLEQLKEAYEDAVGIYDMFTNMASISQIMSLGDFKQQMKTTLDKWGNVLDITLARTI